MSAAVSSTHGSGPHSLRTSGRPIGIRTLSDVCTFVDELEPEAVGEIVVAGGGTTRGAIFVEQGRVCWAAARGMARRLTELLVDRAGGDAEAMERCYRQCQNEGARWGEWLVAKGVLSPGDLRAALFEHTLESIDVLCTDLEGSFWCPRASGGYSPRFTFATAELLVRAGASAHGNVVATVAAELAACFGDDDWGVAFVRSETSAYPQPIALRGNHPMAATDLLRVGRWATSTLDLAGAIRHEDPMLAVEVAPGRSLLAFRFHGAVVVGETSSFGPARILNRRATARRGG